MTRQSVMLTHWQGGGAPSDDARIMTFSGDDPAALLADATAWMEKALGGTAPTLWGEEKPDHPVTADCLTEGCPECES